MAFLNFKALLSWMASATDGVTYRVYQGTEAEPPTYTSPSVDVGNTTTVHLPLAGLPSVEGRIIYAVGAVDGVGNISDLTPISEAAVVDLTPPTPPTEVTFARDF